MSSGTVYPINSFEKVTTQTFNSISVNVQNIVLNQSVTVAVQFYDASGNLADIQFVTLTGADYDNWGKDDSYIVTTVATNLGLTLVSPPASDTAAADIRVI